MDENWTVKSNGSPNIFMNDLSLTGILFDQYSEFYKANPEKQESFSLRKLPIVGNLLFKGDEKAEVIRLLQEKQKHARGYKEWYAISIELDELLDNNTWKLDPKSDLYDYELIYTNMMEMRKARLSKDYRLLLYLIRTKWIRNLGNMGELNLYRHSHVGTKKLIEEYIQECEDSLEYLITDNSSNLDDRYILGMLIQTRKNIGRTALVLSGGSTFGIFHIGVLATLIELNLLPRIVSGSSSGSIMASILCCHWNEEVIEILKGITERNIVIFGEKESEGDHPVNNFRSKLNKLAHFIKYGTLFDINGLKQTMIDFVGDLTFREAYNRTGKILNITVSPASVHEQTRLLNYITAPNCLIWSVVCASCSLPGVFSSTSIYEKNPKTNKIHEWNNDSSVKYVDGSVDNDLPITRLSEMFNVDHIIAVQVNPHVVPILKLSVSNIGGEIENEFNSRFKNALNNVYDFATSEIMHYLQILNEMDIYKNLSGKLISLLSQRYSGDITILPDFGLSDISKIFENPTPEFLFDFIVRGARASWPKVTVIKNHCGVEFALDKSISLLRGRLITSNKPVNNFHHHLTSQSYLSPDEVILESQQTPFNSPIRINDEVLSRMEQKDKSSGIKRNKSVSNSTPSQKLTRRFKRNTTCEPSPSNSIKSHNRGQSVASISSIVNDMSDIEMVQSTESTLVNEDTDNDHNPDYSFRARTYDGNKNSEIRNQLDQINKGIRKAKSSANFNRSNTNDDSNEQSSGYKMSRESSSQVTSSNDSPQRPTISERNSSTSNFLYDKPNFPKFSCPNSLKNSVVGLNRLKDSYTTQAVSKVNESLHDIKQNWKIYGSPDQRRSFSRNASREFVGFRQLNTDTGSGDNQESMKNFTRKTSADPIMINDYDSSMVKDKQHGNSPNGIKIDFGVKYDKDRSHIDGGDKNYNHGQRNSTITFSNPVHEENQRRQKSIAPKKFNGDQGVSIKKKLTDAFNDKTDVASSNKTDNRQDCGGGNKKEYGDKDNDDVYDDDDEDDDDDDDDDDEDDDEDDEDRDGDGDDYEDDESFETGDDDYIDY